MGNVQSKLIKPIKRKSLRQKKRQQNLFSEAKNHPLVILSLRRKIKYTDFFVFF